MESQNKRILNYLKRGHRITPMDALELFGCFRLAARVYDLRSEGNNIAKQIIELSNGVNVAEYYLESSSYIDEAVYAHKKAAGTPMPSRQIKL